MHRQYSEKLEQFKKTGICILQDDTSKDGRAVLVSPAADIAVETINRLITLSNSIVFVALSTSRAEQLLLSPMEQRCPAGRHPNSLISVDAREGITTGISASDRAICLQALASSKADPSSLVKPGHLFPIAVRRGGVLVNNALPEGAADLCSLVGRNEVAAFMDLLTLAGSFMPTSEQVAFAQTENIPLFSLRGLVQYRLQHESLVSRVTEAALPTKISTDFRTIVFRSSLHEGEHLALVKGTIEPEKLTLTRVQTENTFSDVFGGSDCDSRASLHRALELIEAHDRGVLVYLRRPMRGALAEQLFPSEQPPAEPSAALMRDYGIGAQILRDLGVRKINLLSNARKQLVGLDTFGLEIVASTPLGQSEDTANG